MRVLLLQPKYSYPKIDSDVPLIIGMPLGLCYLAAVLREKGCEVKIIDCLAEGYENKEIIGDRIVYGLPDEEIKRRTKAFNPDVVGCSSSLSLQHQNVQELCHLVKKINPKIVTVVGGMHATVRPNEVLSEKYVDFVLRGEADYTFTELVQLLEKGGDFSGIDGIGYKDRKGIHVKSKVHFIKNLDELPFPARDLLKVDQYFKAGLAHGIILKEKRNMSFITSRGCPGGCTFCTIHLLWGRKFRARSPGNVLAELEQMKKKFGITHVQFEDDNLTFDIPRTQKIFKGMIKMNLNIKWNTPNGIALWRMDKETLSLMKKSGCYYVKFAIESGNQRVLSNIIKKPQNLKKVIPLIDYARKIGLKVGSFFVVGFPGETKLEMQETFDFPYRHKLDWFEYSIATPHYGTELRQICLKRNLLIKHSDKDLYTRKGLINTPEFTSDWLEQKIKQENKRYLKQLLIFHPTSFLSQGWEAFRRNPAFVLKYFIRSIKIN